MTAWGGDGTGLAEHREVVGVTSKRLQQGNGIDRSTLVAIAAILFARPPFEGESWGQREQRIQIKRIARDQAMVERISGIGTDRVHQQLAVFRREHQTGSADPTTDSSASMSGVAMSSTRVRACGQRKREVGYFHPERSFHASRQWD